MQSSAVAVLFGETRRDADPEAEQLQAELVAILQAFAVQRLHIRTDSMAATNDPRIGAFSGRRMHAVAHQCPPTRKFCLLVAAQASSGSMRYVTVVTLRQRTIAGMRSACTCASTRGWDLGLFCMLHGCSPVCGIAASLHR